LRRSYGTMPLSRQDSIVTAIVHHIQSPRYRPKTSLLSVTCLASLESSIVWNGLCDAEEQTNEIPGVIL
jgi:hypothetical protein